MSIPFTAEARFTLKPNAHRAAHLNNGHLDAVGQRDQQRGTVLRLHEADVERGRALEDGEVFVLDAETGRRGFWTTPDSLVEVPTSVEGKIAALEAQIEALRASQAEEEAKVEERAKAMREIFRAAVNTNPLAWQSSGRELSEWEDCTDSCKERFRRLARAFPAA